MITEQKRYCVVMRACNDMPLITETISVLEKQNAEYRLVAFDNASVDGTKELLETKASKVFTVEKGSYVPGKVLNWAMEEADGEIVVFLNSDCTPLDTKWLETLVAPFDDASVGAAFGRQVPRDSCVPIHAKDIYQAYGPVANKNWSHGFSMASSAIRRSVWEKLSFNEKLQYSEDIEWTTEIKKMGYKVAYVPDSVVAHSHNYDLQQFYKRNYGEGKAEAVFLPLSIWERSLLRYSIFPFAKQILRDWSHAVKNGNWSLILQSPVYRCFQMAGRRKGFVDGTNQRERYQR